MKLEQAFFDGGEIVPNRSRKGAAQLKLREAWNCHNWHLANRSRKGAAQLKPAHPVVVGRLVAQLTAPERGRHN